MFSCHEWGIMGSENHVGRDCFGCWVWIACSCIMILLQIVMVSPGTNLVKNHESLSITSESQFKNTRSPKLKKFNACTFLYPDS